MVFKTASATANSGVFIRLPEKPRDPWYGVHNGYEVQIDAAGDEWHCTGALYSLSKVTARPQKPRASGTPWRSCSGRPHDVKLNGQVVNDFRGDQPVPPRKMWFEPVRGPRAETGYIGLQNHDAASTVYFKEVSVLR